MQDESRKIRMKPRDPRRILHSNIFQKGGNLEPDQSKINVALASSSEDMKGNLSAQKQEDRERERERRGRRVSDSRVGRVGFGHNPSTA